jgi:type IV secretory pathway VirB4 component
VTSLTTRLPAPVADAVNALPPVVSADGVLVYGVGSVVGLVVLARVVAVLGSVRETPDGGGGPEEVDVAAVAPGASVADPATEQQARLAPEAVEWETRVARVGDEWTTTLHVESFPDYPKDGYLAALFELTDVRFDVTAHCSPRHQGEARVDLQNYADELQADADLETTSRKGYLQERAAEAEATYNAVEEGERVFDKSLFVTVRGTSRDELRENVRTVKATLRDAPAGCEPKTAVCAQDRALRSAAPIGGDEYGRDHIALGGAVGALLASPHSPTILEPGGVEIGVHRDTGAPIVIDPFAREDGYAQFVVGDPGSGKSFSSKQNFVRSIEGSSDRIGVILEPLGNWAGVAAALGAERVTVGGDKTLNPLEIRKPPAHVLESRGEDANPLKERINRAISFFINYFGLRDVGLEDRRSTLERALRTAYARQGITDDVTTHDRPSPTMETVFDVLEEMTESPEEYVVRSEREAEKIERDAVWLLDQLHPFAEGGQFDNLNGSSEVDIRDEDVIYLDMGQQGGSMSGNTALLMELLISLVYERAKETTDEVVFYIDESRYVMKDAETLEFLETIFRHHRHHDLSIRLVTQTIDEFLAQDVSEIILDQCAIKQFHKLDGMDEEIAEKFGLNAVQREYVATATPGSDESGYSEALVGVDGEWRGIRVTALPRETEVIDFDPYEESTNVDTASPPSVGPGPGGETARESDGEDTADALERTVGPRSGGDHGDPHAPTNGVEPTPQPDGGRPSNDTTRGRDAPEGDDRR